MYKKLGIILLIGLGVYVAGVFVSLGVDIFRDARCTRPVYSTTSTVYFDKICGKEPISFGEYERLQREQWEAKQKYYEQKAKERAGL